MTDFDEDDSTPETDVQILTATVAGTDAGTRLDVLAARLFDITRAAAAKAIDAENLTLDGVCVPKRTIVREGQALAMRVIAPMPIAAVPQDIPLDIIYEDADLVVINKPAGMVVHPAPGNPDGTLVNALLYHCRNSLSGIGGALRPGIVHRIDKDTSGLLVVAKNNAAHIALSAQLEGHHISREYRALVTGGFNTDTGTVELPIGRHPTDRKRMAIIREGEGRSRHAVTHYRVLERFGGMTYLSLVLETGRTHQIRVHMAALGHPLLGDTVYGGGNTPFERRHASLLHGQCLHATALTFTHPTSGKLLHFEVPLPDDFSALLRILEARGC